MKVKNKELFNETFDAAYHFSERYYSDRRFRKAYRKFLCKYLQPPNRGLAKTHFNLVALAMRVHTSQHPLNPDRLVDGKRIWRRRHWEAREWVRQAIIYRKTHGLGRKLP